VARPPHVPQSETELEEFFDLSIDPLSIIGFEGEFKRVNASFVRLLGYSKPELFSRSALDILHPDDVEPAREALAQLPEGRDLVGFEARVICADGSARWLEWNTRMMPERGVVYSVGGDTTERRRVDAELREAQRSLEASRDELRVLAEEQAALRRVATLVAQDVPSSELFGAVAREVGALFGADSSGMIRYEDGASVTIVATWAAAGEHPPLPTGWDIEPGDPATIIETTRGAARVDDWASIPGPIAEVIRNVLGVSSSVGCPIVVEGRLWGALAVHCKQGKPLPPDTESRIAQFTDLVATAIANAQARAEVARLAEEQAALRRVATLVAQGMPSDALFSAVCNEVEAFAGADASAVVRFETDGTVTLMGAHAGRRHRVGARLELDPDFVVAKVHRTGRAARFDTDDPAAPGMPEVIQAERVRSALASPIVVEGELWGAITTGSRERPLAAGMERRLAEFTELVATSISNAEARAEVERLAAEQAALRRVATLVAEGASPSVVLDAVVAEMEELLGADQVLLNRFEPGDEVIMLAHRGLDVERTPVGTRLSIEGESVTSMVHRTGRPARIGGYLRARGPIADVAREVGWNVGSAVGAPIVVDGRLWGVIVASWGDEGSPPGDTEERIAKFAQLLDTAIANADSRDQLTASRARLLTAGDEARRHVVRDVHDGAQQRLVHAIVTLSSLSERPETMTARSSRCSARRSNRRSRATASCASWHTGSCPQCSRGVASEPGSTRSWPGSRPARTSSWPRG
jgi:PAS domain S-box-containing protein